MKQLGFVKVSVQGSHTPSVPGAGGQLLVLGRVVTPGEDRDQPPPPTPTTAALLVCYSETCPSTVKFLIYFGNPLPN